MTPFTVEEIERAISQLSAAAQVELERNLYRNRVVNDGVPEQSGVEGETAEA